MWRLTSRLIFPITIISFFLVTKWWHVQPVDAPDTIFTGFPFIYQGPGWGSSMSMQFFVLAFIGDMLIYFLFWFSLITAINHFLIKINLYKPLTIILWSLSVLLLAAGVFIIIVTDDKTFYLKSPYEMKVLETGYQFF